MVSHAVEGEPDADDGGVQEQLGGEAVHVGVPPAEQVHQDKREGRRLQRKEIGSIMNGLRFVVLTVLKGCAHQTNFIHILTWKAQMARMNLPERSLSCGRKE